MSDPRPPDGPFDVEAADDPSLLEPVRSAATLPAPSPTSSGPPPTVGGGDREEWADDDWDEEWDDSGDDSGDDDYVSLRTDQGGPNGWLLAVLTLAVVLIIGLLAVGWWLRTQIDPGNPGEPVALSIPSGATTSDISRLLKTKGVIGNPTVFEWYLRFAGGGPFKAGDYTDLRRNQAMGDVIEVLDRGPAPPPVVNVTFREGLWVSETRQKILDTFPGMDPAALDAALAEVNVPIMPEGSTNPEGVLFPATYEVPKATSNDPKVLLGQMTTAFERVSAAQGLPDATAKLQGAAGKRAITPYEALTVASMVEAEARIPEDRAKIARVIYNRLAAGMRLDIDATVLYALGDRQATLTDSKLKTDSPYNTRLKSGLPPTPINSPGEASIAAALNPAEGDWLYYVLADENGGHYFTNDFNDFNRAVSEAKDKGLL